MAKKFQIFQECCRGLARISLINLSHFSHNFGTRNAIKSIKPSKDLYYSLVSNKNSSQKMAFGVGVQGPMTSSECKQNMHEHTAIMQTSTKKTTSKSKNFFSLQTTRLSPSLEGLNNSLAQSAGELRLGVEYTLG